MVALDADGELVREPCCGTTTARPARPRDLIDELGGAQAWADAVGAVPVASFTASKIRWLARNEPENAARVRRWCCPHDWLTWEIGGRVLRAGHRSRRRVRYGLLRRGRPTPTATTWSSSAFGRPLELPRVAAPDEVVGETPDGLKIAAGTGDNMAATLGMVVPDRAALVSLGTSGTACLRSPTQTHDPSGVVAGFADATGASCRWSAP